MSEKVIKSAWVRKFPRAPKNFYDLTQKIWDPMALDTHELVVEYDDGSKETLFEYYFMEIYFSEGDLAEMVGLTRKQVLEIKERKHKKFVENEKKYKSNTEFDV